MRGRPLAVPRATGVPQTRHFVGPGEQACVLGGRPADAHEFAAAIVVVTGRGGAPACTFVGRELRTLRPPTLAMVGAMFRRSARWTYGQECRRMAHILTHGLRRAAAGAVQRGRRVDAHTPLSELAPDECRYWSRAGHRGATRRTRSAVVAVALVAQRIDMGGGGLPHLPQELWHLVLGFLPAGLPFYTFVCGVGAPAPARDYHAECVGDAWAP